MMQLYPWEPILQYTNTTIHQYYNTPVLQYTNTTIHQYYNTPILQYTNTTIHQYTNELPRIVMKYTMHMVMWQEHNKKQLAIFIMWYDNLDYSWQGKVLKCLWCFVYTGVITLYNDWTNVRLSWWYACQPISQYSQFQIDFKCNWANCTRHCSSTWAPCLFLYN